MEKNKISDSKKNIIEILIALLVLVAYIGYNVYINYQKKEQSKVINTELTIVKDENRYLTVLGCVKKYLNTVQKGNSSDILLLLNDEYKEEYMVNENNYDNFIPHLDEYELYDYVGNEMYFRKISKNVTEYYVYGRIKKIAFEDNNEYTNYNLTVVLYENKLLYSIKPGVA